MQSARQTLSSQDPSSNLQDHCNSQCSQLQDAKSFPHLPINSAPAHQILKSLKPGHSSFYEGRVNLSSLPTFILLLPSAEEHHMLFHVSSDCTHTGSQ